MKAFHTLGRGFRSQCPRKTIAKKIAKSIVGNSILRASHPVQCRPAGQVNRPRHRTGSRREDRIDPPPDRWGRAVILANAPGANQSPIRASVPSVREGTGASGLRFEIEGCGVDAIAEARWLRSVLEEVPEMSAASAAGDFRSDHAVAPVHVQVHVL